MSSSEGKVAKPKKGTNPTDTVTVVVFQAVYVGLMYVLVKFVDPEPKLSFLPFNVESTLCYLILMAGIVQGMMASQTNWARIEYDVPWPYTFALEKNPHKVRFDSVQRAHLNFIEGYPQTIALTYFAAKVCESPSAQSNVCGEMIIEN